MFSCFYVSFLKYTGHWKLAILFTYFIKYDTYFVNSDTCVYVGNQNRGNKLKCSCNIQKKNETCFSQDYPVKLCMVFELQTFRKRHCHRWYPNFWDES